LKLYLYINAWGRFSHNSLLRQYGSVSLSVIVVGCGAIGGLVACRLASAHVPVAVVDLEPVVSVVRARGLTLEEADGTIRHVSVTAATCLAELPPAEVIILALKAQDISQVAGAIGRFLPPRATVVTLQNGLPWWYFQRYEGPHQGHHLRSLDPDGLISRSIPASHIVGCVAYPGAAVIAPGRIRLIEGDRFTLGELEGNSSPRCQGVIDLFHRAGFKAYMTDDIRAELWLKAWGALSFNTISALTRATMIDICDEPATNALVRRMMEEAAAIAQKLGVSIRHTIDRRIEGARRWEHTRRPCSRMWSRASRSKFRA
jgi:2-dehydropantoate 2-reductase